MAAGNARDEYLDASNNVRHYGTLRFAELTIYIAITAGLLTVTYGRPAPQVVVVSAGVKVAGLLVTTLFWILQERTMLYWYHFTNRAVELERDLGFKQYSTRPPAGLLTGRNTLRAFFAVMAVFWIVAIILFP